MSDLMVSVLLLAGAAALVVVSVVVKHRMFPPEEDAEPAQGVVDYIAMMVSVLYALVLGLALVSVWETRDNAESHVQTEASSLNQVYVLAQELPAPAGPQIQQAVTAYVHVVVTQEWPQTAAHKPLGQPGWQTLNQIMTAIESYQPADAAHQNLSAEVLSQLSSVYDARRSRDADSTDGLPPLLWTGLGLGSVLTLAFVFWLGVERRRAHLTMLVGLTGLIGFMMLLIHDLSHPYSGSMGIDPDHFTRFFSGT